MSTRPRPVLHATLSENRSCLVIVDVVGRGNGTDFSESLVAEKFAVLENNVESIGGRDGLAVDDFDGDEFFAVVDEVEAATFASFARIGYRILVDVVPLAIAVDGRTFQRKFQGVAIHLLQKRAAHAVAPDVL